MWRIRIDAFTFLLGKEISFKVIVLFILFMILNFLFDLSFEVLFWDLMLFNFLFLFWGGGIWDLKFVL